MIGAIVAGGIIIWAKKDLLEWGGWDWDAEEVWRLASFLFFSYGFLSSLFHFNGIHFPFSRVPFTRRWSIVWSIAMVIVGFTMSLASGGYVPLIS